MLLSRLTCWPSRPASHGATVRRSVWEGARLASVGAVSLSAAALIVAAVVAGAEAGSSGAGAVVMQFCYMIPLGVAALACLVRGAAHAAARRGWLAIGVAFVFWFVGDLAYWTMSSPPPLLVDGSYVGLYTTASLGMVWLARGARRPLAQLVDTGIAVAGVGSLWAWLLWDRVAGAKLDALLGLKLAYPIADL